MDIARYLNLTNLAAQGEPRRVELLFFYYFKFHDYQAFNATDVHHWCEQLGLPLPNRTRLTANLRKSHRFIKASGGDAIFRLHPTALKELEEELAGLTHEPSKQSAVGVGFINRERLTALKQLASPVFDFSKLIRICEELDTNFLAENYFSVGMLLRAALDHVPPVFGSRSFAEVSNNYAGAKSFKDLMASLETSSRKLSDGYLHTQIRNRETLPNKTQVDFSQAFDSLLAEIIRISS